MLRRHTIGARHITHEIATPLQQIGMGEQMANLVARDAARDRLFELELRGDTFARGNRRPSLIDQRARRNRITGLRRSPKQHQRQRERHGCREQPLQVRP